MANVKLSKKGLLDKFQAEILIKQGKKMTQQELLDKCIEFSHGHFSQFILEKIIHPVLTPEKIKDILDDSDNGPLYYQDKSDDEIIYNL